MDKMFKLAFIGGSIDSAIGYTHLIASSIDRKFRLVSACFSTNPNTNHKTAQEWCKESDFRLYDNYKVLLENEKDRIDCLCILTPTPTHKEIILNALEYKIPIICEKTLCMDTQEAKEIQQNLKNGFLVVTYNYTGYPMLRELKAMIESSEFGRIFRIQIEMPQEGFIRLNPQGKKPEPQDWRLHDEKIPTISLDLGIHCHNLIYFLTHKTPLSVMAMNASYGHFENIVDDVNILAHYEDSMQVNMWFSKSALGLRNGLKLRIFGEKLSGEWVQSNPEELILNTKQGERIIKDRASPLTQNIAIQARYNRFKAGHPAGFIEAFGNYYGDIAESLGRFLDKKEYLSPYIFGIEQSLDGLLFFESVSRSCKSQKLEFIQTFKEKI